MEPIDVVLAGALGVPATAFRFSLRAPLDHQANRLHDVWLGRQHLIAKEFVDADAEDCALREFRSLELLSPLDIAPRPVAYAPGSKDHRPVVLYEYVEGEMWDRKAPTPDQLRALADACIRINSLPTDGLWPAHNEDMPLEYRGQRVEAVLERLIGWSQQFPPAARAIDPLQTVIARGQSNLKAISQIQATRLFCQTDERFANFIQRPDGRLGLVDWEDAGLRDPARQVADLFTHANQEDLLDSQDWKPFSEPYFASFVASDPELPERTHAHIPLFCLFWLGLIIGNTIARIEAGRFADEPVNEMPVNLRLRRYLARALAWPDVDFSKQLVELDDIQFFPSS